MLVATLKHESLYCMAAAAVSLWLVGQIPGGHAVIKASGAIPGLVGVIERRCPAGDLEKERGLFRRYALEH